MMLIGDTLIIIHNNIQCEHIRNTYSLIWCILSVKYNNLHYNECQHRYQHHNPTAQQII